jgi:phosphoglycerate dehydrogenase-like enzyme
VLAADPYATAAPPGVELVALPDLLAQADHVSLHVPLSPESRHLIGPDELAAMRPGAVLVNTARGGLVDEAAVAKAVASGALGGAGLDVTEREPLPGDSPLLGVDRVLLTAHTAAWSLTTEAELTRRSVDAVLALLAGRPPESIVNPRVLDSPDLRIPALRGEGSAGPDP